MLAVLSLISAFTAKGNFGCVEGQVLYVPKVEAAARTTSSPLNVPGIKLSLISETGETTTATTNESGSFHFPHPKFGTYKLEFNGPGGRHFSTRLSVSPRNPTWAMSLRICELTVGDKPSLKLEIRPIPNPGLRRKLLSMVAEDQAVRHRWIAADATKPHPEMMAEMEALNSKHITNLRAWVQKLGWLGPNLVGEDGANRLVPARRVGIQKASFSTRGLRDVYRSSPLSQGQKATLRNGCDVFGEVERWRPNTRTHRKPRIHRPLKSIRWSNAIGRIHRNA